MWMPYKLSAATTTQKNHQQQQQRSSSSNNNHMTAVQRKKVILWVGNFSPTTATATATKMANNNYNKFWRRFSWRWRWRRRLTQSKTAKNICVWQFLRVRQEEKFGDTRPVGGWHLKREKSIETIKSILPFAVYLKQLKRKVPQSRVDKSHKSKQLLGAPVLY